MVYQIEECVSLCIPDNEGRSILLNMILKARHCQQAMDKSKINKFVTHNLSELLWLGLKPGTFRIQSEVLLFELA